MKTLRFAWVLLLLLTACLPPSAEQKSAPSPTRRVHLLFTNDLHGGLAPGPARFMNPDFPPDLGGGASMLAYVRKIRQQARAEDAGMILLDGGNFFQGTPLGMADSGQAVVEWMNRVSYTASTVGPTDFVFGPDHLRRLASKARFPFLSCNLFTADGQRPDWVQPEKLVHFGNLTVAIIGVTTPDLPERQWPELVAGLRVADPVPILQERTAALRARGIRLIIGLVNMGVPYNREKAFADYLTTSERETAAGREQNTLTLAYQPTGLDVIISGGSTAGYRTPWEDPLTHTLVFQGYGNGSNLGHVILEVDRRTGGLLGYELPTYQSCLITLTRETVPPAPVEEERLQRLSALRSRWLRPRFARALPLELYPSQHQVLEVNNYPVPRLGAENTLEVVTWNMEHFPKAADTTIRAVAEVMRDLNADVYAVQEIGSLGAFYQLLQYMPEYAAILSQNSSFYDQALIYRRDVLVPTDREEPFADDDYDFAGRPPLRGDFWYLTGRDTLPLTVIDLHLKCCGNGLERRKKSIRRLHTYLDSLLAWGDTNLVVLGDWNDDVLDTGEDQVFTPLLEDSQDFLFVTARLAADPTQASYPSWPSFLDNILISRGLFDDFSHGGDVRTLPVQRWFGSWERYEATVSDHRPVMVKMGVR